MAITRAAVKPVEKRKAAAKRPTAGPVRSTETPLQAKHARFASTLQTLREEALDLSAQADLLLGRLS